MKFGAERLHRDGTVEHDGDALKRIRPQPARAGENPRQKNDGRELEPERQGIAQAFDAAAAGTHRRESFEKEKRIRDAAARLALEKMNREHGGNSQKGQKAGGIRKRHVHGSDDFHSAKPQRFGLQRVKKFRLRGDSGNGDPMPAGASLHIAK